MTDESLQKHLLTLKIKRIGTLGINRKGNARVARLKEDFDTRFEDVDVSASYKNKGELEVYGVFPDEVAYRSFISQVDNFNNDSRVKFTPHEVPTYAKFGEVDASSVSQETVGQLEQEVLNLREEIQNVTAEKDQAIVNYGLENSRAGDLSEENLILKDKLGILETPVRDKFSEFADKVKVAEEQLEHGFYTIKPVSLDGLVESVNAIGINETVASNEDIPRLIERYSSDEGSALLQQYFSKLHEDRLLEYLSASMGIEQGNAKIESLRGTGLDDATLQPSIGKVESDMEPLRKITKSYEDHIDEHITSASKQLVEIGRKLEEYNKMQDTKVKVQEIFGDSKLPVRISSTETDQDYTIEVHLPVKKGQQSQLKDLLLREVPVHHFRETIFHFNDNSEILSYEVTLPKSECSSSDAFDVVRTLEQQIAQNYVGTSLPEFGTSMDLDITINKIIGPDYAKVQKSLSGEEISETVTGPETFLPDTSNLEYVDMASAVLEIMSPYVDGILNKYGKEDTPGLPTDYGTEPNDEVFLKDTPGLPTDYGTETSEKLDNYERRRLLVQYIIEAEKPLRLGARAFIKEQTGVEVTVSQLGDDVKYFRRNGVLRNNAPGSHSPYGIIPDGLSLHRDERLGEGLIKILSDEGQDLEQLSNALRSHVDVPFSDSLTNALERLPVVRKVGDVYMKNLTLAE